jgi:hypothetical protein
LAIKKIDRVSPGFDRVDRVPGRPGFAGSIPERVFASTWTSPRPGSTRRANSGFKTLVGKRKVIFFFLEFVFVFLGREYLEKKTLS